MPTITRSEWVRVWVLALIVVAVTSVPYALGFARSDVQHVYSGTTLDFGLQQLSYHLEFRSHVLVVAASAQCY